jgi:tRNA threonylcarbamoyladenosine biosynthesis protein TsaE
VISLCGELGAGKTVFVKGLARGMGVDEELVSSPTFVLANQYLSPGNGLVLHHVDFYRLEAAGELESMGFFDMMGPGTLLVVEWGPKFLEEMPEDRLEVTIDVEPGRGPDERIFRARGTGPESRGVAEEWGRRLSAVAGRTLLDTNLDANPDANPAPDPNPDADSSPGEGLIGK